MNIHIRGTVQGVGFRPFVYRLAGEMKLKGYVRNEPGGVEIHIEGDASPANFLRRLRSEAPPHARIDGIETSGAGEQGLKDFVIITTRQGEAAVFAPPDLFLCGDCLKELFDPGNRRYRYPFINCTRCGPRYTIIDALPYDREKTSMRAFRMCPACEREYNDPDDRRFHAEPNACPVCGPRLSFIEKGRAVDGDEAVERAVRAVKTGKVVAVKGLGGFHLVCDPRDSRAVRRLRTVKDRQRKPFALMASGVDAVREIAWLDDDERQAIESPERPVVLLRKKAEIEHVAPGIGTYGVMLPYTPVHALLTEKIPLLIATSANARNGPLLKDEGEGVHGLCDCVLTHDRDIHVRCDDSVLKVVHGKRLFLRRGRGFVPGPVEMKRRCDVKVLALGGELKNTITILKDGYLITSQYLGDMRDLRNRRYLEEVIGHFSALYAFTPDVVACDLHPDFTTTRMAERSGRRTVGVQHHVAHVYAVLAEYGLDPGQPFLGVAFDGTGYGADGRIWGGEFFLGGGTETRRLFHLKYVPQQGGDLSVREPWRMALSHLMTATGGFRDIGLIREVDHKRKEAVADAIRKQIHAPLTSSMGRLFDAVAALTGVAPMEIDFEAEPAMRLESAAAGHAEDVYPFDIAGEEIDVGPTIAGVARDVEQAVDAAVISAKFHGTIALVIARVAELVKQRYGINRIVLGGGVFLNAVLLEACTRLLAGQGMDVYVPGQFPPGDEAISLGQAYYTAWCAGVAS